MEIKHKNWKHFDLAETIQDNAGGGTKKGRLYPDSIDIHYPPSKPTDGALAGSPMEEGWIMTPSATGDGELINELMEDVRRLERDNKRKEERLREASVANEKWYRYNQKMEEQMEKMKKKVKQLELDLSDEKEDHAKTRAQLEDLRLTGNNGLNEASGGVGDKQSLSKMEWMEKELYLTNHQLKYCQEQLREQEMKPQMDVIKKDWDCPRCTFINSKDNGKCEMCGYKATVPKRKGKLVPDGILTFDE